MKKSKKLLSILLAVLMLTALMPFSALAAALPFSDVPQDAWYYPVVRDAYEKGITNGTSRGHPAGSHPSSGLGHER